MSRHHWGLEQNWWLFYEENTVYTTCFDICFSWIKLQVILSKNSHFTVIIEYRLPYFRMELKLWIAGGDDCKSNKYGKLCDVFTWLWIEDWQWLVLILSRTRWISLHDLFTTITSLWGALSSLMPSRFIMPPIRAQNSWEKKIEKNSIPKVKIQFFVDLIN